MKLAVVLVAAAAIIVSSAVAQETPQPVKEISLVGPPDCTSGPGLRCTDLTNYPYIYLDGYRALSDGGGGYFVQGRGTAQTSCTDNGGTVLKDHGSPRNCFYRAST